jgi:hypothetical protein
MELFRFFAKSHYKNRAMDSGGTLIAYQDAIKWLMTTN